MIGDPETPLPPIGLTKLPVGDKVAPPKKDAFEFDVEALNRQAKNAFFRRKLAQAMAQKNPKAWEQIAAKWSEMSADPVTHTAQARQRVSFDVDKGQTKLTKDELKKILGEDYDEFVQLRKETGAYNTGVVKNPEYEMEGFGFDDLAPTIQAGTWEDALNNLYYKPEYEDGEMYIDTNIPQLQHLIKKRKQLDKAIAKQMP